MQIKARSRLKLLHVAGFSLIVLSLSGTARAQPSRNVDLPQLQPAPAGDRFFAVPSPYTPGNLVLHGGVLLDYAKNPLVVSDSAGSVVGHVVEHQLLLHLDVSLTLSDRVSFNADIPFALVNRGDGTVEAGAFTGANAFVSPSGAGVGDLRLGARLRIFGGYFDPFQVAVGGFLWIPTGTRNDYLTDGNVRGQVQLLLGGLVDRFIWSAMGAPTFRSSQSYGDIQLGSQLNWGGGAGVLLGDARNVQSGLETIGGVTLVKSARSFNSEVLGGVKVRAVDPVELGVAVGRGFSTGLGTPDYSGALLMAVLYAQGPQADHDRRPRRRRHPRRGRRLPRREGRRQRRRSEEERLPAAGDRDGDGIPDDEDACPDVTGVRERRPEEERLPAPRPRRRRHPRRRRTRAPTWRACRDRRPEEERLPAATATATASPTPRTPAPTCRASRPTTRRRTAARPTPTATASRRRGRLPGREGPRDPDPKKRLPEDVRVTSTEIVILEQVQFDTDKATIRPVERAARRGGQVVREHPEIQRIEVQGHTDDRGARPATRRSRRRAPTPS